MTAANAIAGPGQVCADLGNPICVVLDCDNTTATTEDFGPATRLGERFLWRLFEFEANNRRYEAFREHITNKAKLAEALSSTGRPVLVLIDEIMTTSVLQPHQILTARFLTWRFCGRCLMWLTMWRTVQQ